jgi:hypothetical protein
MLPELSVRTRIERSDPGTYPGTEDLRSRLSEPAEWTGNIWKRAAGIPAAAVLH